MVISLKMEKLVYKLVDNELVIYDKQCIFIFLKVEDIGPNSLIIEGYFFSAQIKNMNMISSKVNFQRGIGCLKTFEFDPLFLSVFEKYYKPEH